jgi:hypothetical protein
VEWLPENHPVFFQLDLAAELSLKPIHTHYRQKDPQSEQPYEPQMLTKSFVHSWW